MTLKAVLALAAAGAVLAVAAPTGAKTRSELVDPHCVEEASVAAPGHRLNCAFDGFGKFDINAEASLKKGASDASALLAIAVDGHPCGHSDPVWFSGRQIVYQACSVREVGLDSHAFTVSLDVKGAEYGSMDVNVVRHVPGAHKPGK